MNVCQAPSQKIIKMRLLRVLVHIWIYSGVIVIIPVTQKQNFYNMYFFYHVLQRLDYI